MISGEQLQLERLHKRADRMLDNIIKEHIQATTTKSDEADLQEELVDVLLKFHDENGGPEFSLSIDNIKAVILDIFTGRSETSATTVDWTMSEMIKQPRIMKKAQDEVREVFNRTQQVNETSVREMEYLKLIIQESLRLHPPAPLLAPRVCGKRCETDGYEILKTKVIVIRECLGNRKRSQLLELVSRRNLIQRDSLIVLSIIKEPTLIHPIWCWKENMPCHIIYLYGLANVELPLAMLLYHFDWKLPNGMKNEDLDMIEEFGAVVHRKYDLHLIPTPYHRPPTDVISSKI